MRLVAFQVKNCFGFRDSGVVNLDDPTNLIYLLGKNSSGKTSLLTALAAMSSRRVPSDYPTFRNYDPSDETPCLLAKYTVKPGELTAEAIVNRVAQGQDDLSRSDPTFFNSPEFNSIKSGTAQAVRGIIGVLVREIELRGAVWVVRLANGYYQFVPEGTRNESITRATQLDSEILKMVQKLHNQNTMSVMYIAGGQRSVQLLSGTQIESLLFYLFPQTAWFNEAYSLLDNLPEALTSEHLSNSPNRLTTALIAYLGKDELRRLLTVKNTEERRRLEAVVRAKMDELVADANQGGSHDENVFGVDLDRSDGLQISMLTTGKQSSYSHISDNTKLLFAYHLYSRVYDLAGKVLLFDEPSNGFHASAQSKLLSFFRWLGGQGTLIIISNHSEHLIDPDYLGGVRLMEADDQAYLHVSNHYYRHKSGEREFLALRPIADAIGLKYGAIQLAHADRVVVTEGVTDMLYLHAFRRLLGYEGTLRIAPAIGEHEIPPVLALLIAQGISFKLAIDTSTGGSTVKSKVQKGYLIGNEYIHEVPIPATSASKTGSGIEDLFSKADFKRLLESIDESVLPEFETMSNSEYMTRKAGISKRLVADWFSKHVGEYTAFDFDEETLALFRDTLDFCFNDQWFRI